MADKLQFELVSPEKLLLSELVGMVVVPGTEGNFGVLPGHALFISTVRPGVIDVYEDGMPTVTERIFVAGGVAEVTPERCTVLADEAVPLAALDRGVLVTQRDIRRGMAKPPHEFSDRGSACRAGPRCSAAPQGGDECAVGPAESGS